MKEHIIEVTWNPVAGNLYRVVDKSGHLLNTEPKAVYSYQRKLYKTEDRRLYLNEGDIFMFLGQRQRIPEHYSFFKILHKDLVCWLLMPERLYEEIHRIINPIPLI